LFSLSSWLKRPIVKKVFVVWWWGGRSEGEELSERVEAKNWEEWERRVYKLGLMNDPKTRRHVRNHEWSMRESDALIRWE
jgi:hypothetical protein